MIRINHFTLSSYTYIKERKRTLSTNKRPLMTKDELIEKKRKAREYHREYYRKKGFEYGKIYYDKNKVSISEKRKKAYQENRDEIRFRDNFVYKKPFYWKIMNYCLLSSRKKNKILSQKNKDFINKFIQEHQQELNDDPIVLTALNYFLETGNYVGISFWRKGFTPPPRIEAPRVSPIEEIKKEVMEKEKTIPLNEYAKRYSKFSLLKEPRMPYSLDPPESQEGIMKSPRRCLLCGLPGVLGVCEGHTDEELKEGSKESPPSTNKDLRMFVKENAENSIRRNKCLRLLMKRMGLVKIRMIGGRFKVYSWVGSCARDCDIPDNFDKDFWGAQRLEDKETIFDCSPDIAQRITS